MEWQNKWKPTDRSLIPKVLDTIPDAELFQRMQEVESNLDALVQRKRLDLQDMIGRSMRKNETLRIFVSSSVANQPWQEGPAVSPENGNPHWSLRIEGRLVHDNAEKTRAFSSMITSVIVELNKKKTEEAGSAMEGVEVHSDSTGPAAQPAANSPAVPAGPSGSNDTAATGDSTGAAAGTPGASSAAGGATPRDGANENASTQGYEKHESQPDEIVEWHEACVPPDQRVDFDGLDVRRPGSEVINARIFIQLKEYPDKFDLSPQLAEILGVSEESKPGAVVSLWQYIRYHNLQDVDEKRLIKCDEPLFNLFKREKIMLPQLVELLAPHLSPRGPLVIDYTIDPTQDVGNRDVAFDVPIQVDHSLRDELLAMLSTWHQDNEVINELEDLLLQDVQALNLLAHQHDFYESFSKEPAVFLDKLIASQARDLKIIYCDRQFSEEAVRHSSFYTDDLLNPSLHLFLGKQQ